jgi:competence protein ComEC
MRIPGPPSLSALPALRAALLFAAGVVINPVPGSAFVLALLLTILLAASAFVVRQNAAASILRILIPSLLLVMLGSLKIAADRAGLHVVPDSLALREVTVIGDIASPAAVQRGRLRFILHAEGYAEGDRVVPLGALLSVSVTGFDADHRGNLPAQGYTIALRGTLSPPPPRRNPGDFDMAGYYTANGISGVLTAPGPEHLLVIDSAGGSWVTRQLVTPVRSAIRNLADSLIRGEEGEFLKGLLIGDRAGLAPETMEAFVNSGVAHVLAVSGSNVAVVALMLGFLTGLFRLPQAIRTVAAAAGLLFYMVLTGSQPPVVRATITALAFMAGGIVQRQANAANSLGAAGLIILLLDARQLFDAGFQLSFCAVFGIVHFTPAFDAWISLLKGGGWWRTPLVQILRLCAVSVAATIGTLPVTAAWFGRVSLIGVAANIPVVPATGVSVVLGGVAVLLAPVSSWCASACSAVNAVLLRWTLVIIREAGIIPWASVTVSGIPLAVFVSGCLGFAFVLRRKGWAAVRAGLVVLLLTLNLLLFCPSPTGKATRGVLRVHVIDVGQGDAILLEFPGGQTALVDAGPLTPGFDAGERTVVPYLRRLGIRKIDELVVTHPHSDHLGGVPSLLRHLEVGEIIESGQPIRSRLYASYLHSSAEHNLRPRAAARGLMLNVTPDARLYVLAPAPQFLSQDTTRPPPNLNNTSVMIRLLYGSVAILLAGDAEQEAEEAVTTRYGAFIRSNFLKVGHHGSSTSSSPRFLDAVQPAMAAVSVGRFNRFHHPSPETILRLASTGSTVARTDMDGAIIVETDGITLRRILWR